MKERQLESRLLSYVVRLTDYGNIPSAEPAEFFG